MGAEAVVHDGPVVGEPQRLIALTPLVVFGFALFRQPPPSLVVFLDVKLPVDHSMEANMAHAIRSLTALRELSLVEPEPCFQAHPTILAAFASLRNIEHMRVTGSHRGTVHLLRRMESSLLTLDIDQLIDPEYCFTITTALSRHRETLQTLFVHPGCRVWPDEGDGEEYEYSLDRGLCAGTAILGSDDHEENVVPSILPAAGSGQHGCDAERSQSLVAPAVPAEEFPEDGNLPSLTHLRISGCAEVSGVEFFKLCPNLDILEVGAMETRLLPEIQYWREDNKAKTLQYCSPLQDGKWPEWSNLKVVRGGVIDLYAMGHTCRTDVLEVIGSVTEEQREALDTVIEDHRPRVLDVAFEAPINMDTTPSGLVPTDPSQH